MNAFSATAERPSAAGTHTGRRFDPRRFVRGEPAVSGPVTLTHRRVFILPSRRGLGLAALLALLFLVAVNYNNNLAFMLTFLLASVALVSLLHTFRNLSGLIVRGVPGPPVFAGESARYDVHCESRSSLRRGGVQVRRRIDQTAGATVDVLGRQTAVVGLRVRTERRGRMSPGTVTLSTGFPFGLFRAWAPVNFGAELLVYPCPAPAGGPEPAAAPGSDGGARAAHDGDDFHGFAAYSPGDSLRRVHWRGVAKGQAAQVKRFRGAEAADIDLDWRTTPGADVEARIARLCRWVIDAEQAGRRYGLRLPDQHIARGRGAAHRHRCLEALALFRS